MNTKTETGPLFANVDELHTALIDYAKQALRATALSDMSSITTADRDDAHWSRLETAFAACAKERFAQIAMALWMEKEANAQEKVEVDGIPLSSLEEAIYGSSFGASFTRVNIADNASNDGFAAVRAYRGRT